MKFKKHRFDRVVITKDGGIIFLPPVIKHYRTKALYEIDQWMGAGKSVVGMEHLGRVHARGGTIMANMAIGYMPHNQGKPKDKWTPNIQCLEDLKGANNCTILIDDFKKIVQRWQCSEAVFIGMVANESRKDKKDILITAQRVVNFIPKDIREVCTNYEIPYVTIRDQRVESPDGMGMPVEIEVFNVSATGSFLGFGIWNGFFPDGKVLMPTKKMLDMYSTLEVVTDLKQEGAENINQPGRIGEVDLYGYLKTYHPDINIQLKNGKGTMDIETDLAYIDNVGVTHNGRSSRLNTGHKKKLREHKDYCKLHKIPGWIAYWWHNDYLFLKITSKYLLRDNPTVTPALLAASRSHRSVFG